eukprot:4604493-Prymnesium_polylepis.1
MVGQGVWILQPVTSMCCRTEGNARSKSAVEFERDVGGDRAGCGGAVWRHGATLVVTFSGVREAVALCAQTWRILPSGRNL